MRKYFINGIEVSSETYTHYFKIVDKQILDQISLALQGLTNFNTYLFDINFKEEVKK